DVIPISSIADDRRFRELITGSADGPLMVNTYPVGVATELIHLFDPLLRDYWQLFAGRDAELQALRATLADDTRADGVVTEPAGLGKTALMAEFAASTPAAGYHFFTPSMPQSTEELTFARNLLQQLAVWHGSTGDVPDSLPEVKAAYFALLARPL